MFLRALTHSEHLSVWHRSTHRVGTHLHFIIMDELLCRAKHHKCSLHLFPIFRISSQIHHPNSTAGHFYLKRSGYQTKHLVSMRYFDATTCLELKLSANKIPDLSRTQRALLLCSERLLTFPQVAGLRQVDRSESWNQPG